MKIKNERREKERKTKDKKRPKHGFGSRVPKAKGIKGNIVITIKRK